MRRRSTRRVLEMGTGPFPKKLIGLAKRHPKTDFHGVDVGGIWRKTFRLFFRRLPKNLTLTANKPALYFLEEVPNHHFTHVYSHFLENSLSSRERVTLMKEVYRTLQVGGRYTIVNIGQFGELIKHDLQTAGFEVREKIMTADQIESKLGTPYAKQYAKSARGLIQFFRGLSPEARRAFLEKNMKIEYRAIIEREFRAPSQEYMERVRKAVEKIDPSADEQFVVLVGIKRK